MRLLGRARGWRGRIVDGLWFPNSVVFKAQPVGWIWPVKLPPGNLAVGGSGTIDCCSSGNSLSINAASAPLPLHFLELVGAPQGSITWPHVGSGPCMAWTQDIAAGLGHAPDATLGLSASNLLFPVHQEHWTALPEPMHLQASLGYYLLSLYLISI